MSQAGTRLLLALATLWPIDDVTGTSDGDVRLDEDGTDLVQAKRRFTIAVRVTAKVSAGVTAVMPLYYNFLIAHILELPPTLQEQVQLRIQELGTDDDGLQPDAAAPACLSRDSTCEQALVGKARVQPTQHK